MRKFFDKIAKHKICIRYIFVLFGGIAQLVEHLPCKQGVSGSTPLISTNTGL